MNEQGSMMKMNQQQQHQMMMSMNPHQQQQQLQQMMNRSYGMWPPPPQIAMDPMKFQNPKGFVAGGKQSKPLGPRNNWKGKKGNDKRIVDGGRRKEKGLMTTGVMTGGVSGGGGNVGGLGGYKPPALNELQCQNRLKARRFFPKKKFYHNNNSSYSGNMSAPFAPRNTSSYIIRAKKSGGIASLVSPCPVTPAVLPTPIFSPSREVLVDMAKEEWGVDGYGSMKGLIRLRSPSHEMEVNEDDEEEEGGSSESDLEEHVEVERRLDHDLSRFEMIYPNCSGLEYNNVLENRVDDQDSHIAQLEEENLILKERLFLMERELGDLRRRLQSLERQGHGCDEINEEVVENESESESHSVDDNNIELFEQNMEEGDGEMTVKEVKKEEAEANDGDIESARTEEKVEKGNEEINLTLVDESLKKEEITLHTRSESESKEDVKDDNKAEVTQRNEDIESMRTEEKVEKGNEEVNLTHHDESHKKEEIDSKEVMKDGNKAEVTQRKEDNKNNIESLDKAGVGDETMEDASRLDNEAVTHGTFEEEERGNE